MSIPDRYTCTHVNTSNYKKLDPHGYGANLIYNPKPMVHQFISFIEPLITYKTVPAFYLQFLISSTEQSGAYAHTPMKCIVCIFMYYITSGQDPMELASQIVATLTESTNMVGPEVRMDIIYHTVENLRNKTLANLANHSLIHHQSSHQHCIMTYGNLPFFSHLPIICTIKVSCCMVVYVQAWVCICALCVGYIHLQCRVCEGDLRCRPQE